MNALRQHGVQFGALPATENNHIADIDGVGIGHVTVHDGGIHTGITLVKPHDGDVFREKAFAGFYAGNGFGKCVGSTQVEELGNIESILGLTNTLAVGTVLQELVRYHVHLDKDIGSINVFVGETNDGFLNDISSLPITADHVKKAVYDVRERNFSQGAIGAGAGTRAFGFKGGIGSASRVIEPVFTKTHERFTLGVLMQSNYGGFLRLHGKEIWRRLGGNRMQTEIDALKAGGSCMILVATDAPLLPRQLKRLARRAFSTLTRTGSFISHGSGDYALAWSTHPSSRVRTDDYSARWNQGPYLSDASIDPFFAAVCDATEEALWNSITTSETVHGYKGEIKRLTCEEILEAMNYDY